MTSIILNHFAKQTREQVDSIAENDFYALDMFSRIEFFLITNGYTDHQFANKIEIVNKYFDGADSFVVEILSTKKRCRKPSCCHVFRVNTRTSNAQIELIEAYTF